MRFLSRKIIATAAAAAVLSGAGVSQALPQDVSDSSRHSTRPLAGMRVLLSNDDSMQAADASNSDGLGLYELRRSLCNAGADVVVIAPWKVQSGRGTAVTLGGTFTLARRTTLPAGYGDDCSGAASGAPVYGVCVSQNACGPNSPSATPADTVMLALRGGLAAKTGWRNGPDLVVTGANSGSNVASSVNYSGTVGAAIAAIDEGVPAIAFSAPYVRAASNFPLANYRATAEWGAKFVEGLRERHLLTDKFALKVDYPDVSGGATAKAPVWTRVGDGAIGHQTYTRRANTDSFDISLTPCTDTSGPECTETREDADSTWLTDKGHITVAPITWDRTYGSSIDSRKELRRIEQYVRHAAPRR